MNVQVSLVVSLGIFRERGVLDLCVQGFAFAAFSRLLVGVPSSQSVAAGFSRGFRV